MADSPYKFLSFYDFTEEDARLFFGREQETQILLSDILVARLVVLFAETGTGKTSLINAGVRPRLEEREYKTFLVRVLEDPIQSTRAELSSHPEVPALRGQTLAEELVNLSEDLNAPLVIFFDQFEEFFISTFRENRAQAEAFIRDIATLYENPEAGVHIVFSLREDWFVEMNHFRDDIPTIFHNDSNLRLRWFEKKQAREAIRGPASAVRVTIEPRLIIQITRDLLLKDRGIEPAQLQIVCDALWKDHTGNLITLKGDYARLGQRKGEANIAKQILDQHFENIFGAIKLDEQLNLLERLLPLLRTERNTKFGRDVDTLIDKLQTDAELLNSLLKHLEDAKLIRRSRRESLTIIELAHDYLAPQIPNLTERVQAIALRRLLGNAMQKTRKKLDARRQEMTGGGSGTAEILGESGKYYLSPEDFDRVFTRVRVLSELSQDEVTYLFEAALELGEQLTFWFGKARDSKIDVWKVLEQKITNPEAIFDQAEHAVSLLGLLKTNEALKLLELALQQEALASQAINVLGDWESDRALQLMFNAVNERRSEGSVIEKLSAMDSRAAIDALESFLPQKDLTDRATSGLERLSRSRSLHIATRAKQVLDQWRAAQPQAETPEKVRHIPDEIAARPRAGWRKAPSLPGPKLKEGDWAVLLRRIQDGKCTPILGPGMVEDFLPDSSQIASDLAKENNYPLDDHDDLRQVAQFVAVTYDVEYLKRKLVERFRQSAQPHFDDSSEPHRILSSLPLPIYLTTNFDDYMVRALQHDVKDAKVDFCHWNNSLSDFPSIFEDGFVPSVANPAVFHLWGNQTEPDSLVVTELDYMDFLSNTSRDPHLIPARIQKALTGTSLLFLGYGARDFDLQFLLGIVLPMLSISTSRTHIAVLSLTVADSISEEQVDRSREYFEFYFERVKRSDIRVYWGTAREFLVELQDRWKQFH